MALTADNNGRTARFSLRGAVTGTSGGGQLRDRVKSALADGATRIEINLGGVRFLDAAGLGDLVACRTLAHQAGAHLRLTGAIGKVLELLRLTRLDRLLVDSLMRHRPSHLGHHLARNMVPREP